MKIKSEEIIEDLRDKTSKMIEAAEAFIVLSEEQLNRKPSIDNWSILECFDHINKYGDIYLNEIEKQILNSEHSFSNIHKTGWLGNYSANIMLPRGDKIPMKMKTFKSMNPSRSDLSLLVIDKFIKQQKHYLILLDKCKKVNLTKTKCGLAIKGLKFKLGDAMRFYTFHNVRHIEQASSIIGKMFQF